MNQLDANSVVRAKYDNDARYLIRELLNGGIVPPGGELNSLGVSMLIKELSKIELSESIVNASRKFDPKFKYHD